MSEILELENLIKRYADAYYSGEAIVSDEVFDSLVDKLRQLSPNSKLLNTGWGFEVDGNKVKHKYVHIGSLDKTKCYEDFPSRFKCQDNVFISPKLDGLSAVAYYNKGKLIKGITRGNGEYGKDITDKLKVILSDTISDSSFTGAVRGELIINADNWSLLQNKYENLIAPRNFAAGIVNRNDITEDVKFLDMVVYKVVGQENSNLLTLREQMLYWLSCNFTHSIPIYKLPRLTSAAWEANHQSIFNSFKQLGYGLDGLVITSSKGTYNKDTNGILWDEFAFKFKSDTAITTIKEIEWTLSRTNRYVPVAVVEPVELSGAMIQRATCNNAKMVSDLGIGSGSEIEIMRANEIIPQITSVINPTFEDLPSVCPSCKQNLIWQGVDLKCDNPNCPNVKLSDLQQWCEVIGETDGLQWTLMQQYLSIYNINSLEDLYAKSNEVMSDMSSRQLSITEQKILSFFNKLYYDKVNSYKALLALNIPRLGDKTCKLLSSEQHLIVGFYNYLVDLSLGKHTDGTYYFNKFIEIVKEATQQSIYANATKFLNLRYLFINNRIQFEEANKTVNTKFIAVTGNLSSMSRKEFENFISSYGYELSTNLKKCEYLVTNTPNSGSSKNKQAVQYNIPIITETEFLNTLK